MQKIYIRQTFLKKRYSLSVKEFQGYNFAIKKLFLSHFPITKEHIVHTYISNESKREVDTLDIIREIEKKGSTIVVPKVDGSVLQCCKLTKNTVLSANHWGIQEPQYCSLFDPIKINIVVVPCVSFDIHGDRVGYGGGYYDKFLKKCSTNVVKVALSFFEPILKIEDKNEYDVKMDYCVTPFKIFSF